MPRQLQRGCSHLILKQTAIQEGGVAGWLRSQDRLWETRARLVFPTVLELITTAWVTIPYMRSTWNLCPPPQGGGNQRPLPTRQALLPSGASGSTPTDTSPGLSLGDQTAHAHPTTPMMRTAAPPLHSPGTSPHRQLRPDTQFHKRRLKSAHLTGHTNPHEDTPF